MSDKIIRKKLNLSLLIDKTSTVLTIIGFIVITVFFIWALDRGFEITDESYYMLLAIHPEKIKLFLSAQHWLIAPLWSLTGSLFGFRTIGLGILLFTPIILANGVVNAFSLIFKTRTLKLSERAVILSCSLSGALLYGATINFSPCYNLLASAASYIAVGCVLLSIGVLPNWRFYMLNLIAGCSIAIAMLSKFSAGFAVLCLLITVILFLKSTIKRRMIAYAQIFLGMMAGLLVIIFSHSSISNLIEEIKFGMSIFKLVQVEPTTVRLMRYAHEFFEQQVWSGMFFLIPLVYLSKSKRLYKNIPIYTIIAIICTILLSCIHLPHAFTLSRWVGVSASLTAILALTLISTVPVWTKDFNSAVLTIALCILPYCVAFGTGNGIHTQIVVSIASWGTLISMIVNLAKIDGYNNKISMLACVAFVLLIAIQAGISGLRPYGLNKPIWEQSVSTKIGAIGTVRVDEATHKFVLSLTESMKKSKILEDSAYLGFYGMPGVALVIQGIPVFSPWLTNAKQSEVMLSRVDSEFLKSAVIGVTPSIDGKLPLLPKQFYDFPKGYKNIGEAIYPNGNQRIQLWILDQ